MIVRRDQNFTVNSNLNVAIKSKRCHMQRPELKRSNKRIISPWYANRLPSGAQARPSIGVGLIPVAQLHRLILVFPIWQTFGHPGHQKLSGDSYEFFSSSISKHQSSTCRSRIHRRSWRFTWSAAAHWPRLSRPDQGRGLGNIRQPHPKVAAPPSSFGKNPALDLQPVNRIKKMPKPLVVPPFMKLQLSFMRVNLSTGFRH